VKHIRPLEDKQNQTETSKDNIEDKAEKVQEKSSYDSTNKPK
jgi:hypothetical protein